MTTRTQQVYDFLVDETENPDTIYNKTRHDKLTELLPLFEYLLGNEDENPLDKVFTSDDDIALEHRNYVDAQAARIAELEKALEGITNLFEQEVRDCEKWSKYQTARELLKG
jgi:hypothetical protein